LNFTTPVEKFKLITSGIIALHGVLPDVKNLEEINQISLPLPVPASEPSPFWILKKKLKLPKI